MSMMCGGWDADVTVKVVDEVAVPPGVVTLITPVAAPGGTDVLMCESSVTVNVALTPLKNFTALALVNPVPVIVTGVPTGPLVGLKLVIVGVGEVVTVKLAVEVTVPPGAVTVIAPVAAVAGTDVLMCEASVTVNVALTPLKNFTALAPVNPVPVIVTGVPTGPLVGLKPVIVGVGEVVTVKLAVEVTVPPGAVTVIAPVAAVAGTDVLMCEASVTENAAVTPLKNFTALAPVNPVPVIVTGVPTGPLVGLKLVIVGTGAVPVLKVAMAPVHAADALSVAE
jgi:hypothetical protein